MYESAIGDILKDLLHVESKILANDVPYPEEGTAQLYSAVKLLRDSAEFLLHNKQADSYKSERVREQVKKLYELTQKLNQISQTRVPLALFNAIYEEVAELNGVIVDAAYSQQLDSKAKAENQDLKKQLVQYQKMLEDIKSRSLNIEAKAEKIQVAADALAQVAEKKTSQEWTDEYASYVLYEESFDSSRRLIKSGRRLAKIINYLYSKCLKLYSIIFKDVALYRGLSYNNTAKKWQFYRSLWLFFFFLTAIAYLVAFWNYDFTSHSMIEFILEKTRFVPVLLVATIGFTFASRNYKINSHLLEQYKHRYVVAKTMNNLMTLDNLKDERITIDLIQLGSKILFEFKNSGYMNKDDKELMNYKDIAEFIMRRNA